jgi:MFS family permease
LVAERDALPRRRAPLLALLIARSVSDCGTSMTLLAIPWFVLRTTGSATQTGAVAAAESVGLVVSFLCGSPLVDRFGARAVSVASAAVAAVAVAAVPVLSDTTGLPLPALAGLSLLIGLSRAPGETAQDVLLPSLVTLADMPLERATGAVDGGSRAARMVGAPLAGVLVAAIGPARVLYADAGTFLFSALLIWLIVPLAASADTTARAGFLSYLAQFLEGARYLRTDRLVLGIVLMVSATNGLDAGMASVALPVYATDVLHSSVAFGLITAALGAGAVAGAVIFSWRGSRWRRWPVYLVAYFAVGAPRFAIFLLRPGLPVLLAVTFLLGIGSGMINPILNAVLYERVPQRLRARVFGTLNAGALACVPLGSLLVGLLTGGLGWYLSIMVIGVLYFAATLCPMVFPSWRQLDRYPEPVSARG